MVAAVEGVAVLLQWLMELSLSSLLSLVPQVVFMEVVVVTAVHLLWLMELKLSFPLSLVPLAVFMAVALVVVEAVLSV